MERKISAKLGTPFLKGEHGKRNSPENLEMRS